MDTQLDTKPAKRTEVELRHSALEEFSRDERRPAVIMLGLLALGAVFFAIGILVGRFTIQDRASLNPHNTQPAAIQTTAAQPEQQNAPATQETQRRFSILVGTYKPTDNAQSVIRDLTRKGYQDIRTDPADATARTHQSFSLLIGHYTRQEAEQEAARLRSSQDPHLKNATIIEDQTR